MRFIQVAFVVASATLTLFNTYAYAMPAEMSSSDSAKHLQADWCGGLTDAQCQVTCSQNGWQNHACNQLYVHMP